MKWGPSEVFSQQDPEGSGIAKPPGATLSLPVLVLHSRLNTAAANTRDELSLKDNGSALRSFLKGIRSFRWSFRCVFGSPEKECGSCSLLLISHPDVSGGLL